MSSCRRRSIPAWAPGATETRIRLCYRPDRDRRGRAWRRRPRVLRCRGAGRAAHRHAPRRRGPPADREARRHSPVPLALLRHRRLVRGAGALGHPRQGRRPAGLQASRERAGRGGCLCVDRAEPDAGPARRRLPAAAGRRVPGGEAPHPQRYPRRGPRPGEGRPKGGRRRNGDHGRRQPDRRHATRRCRGRTGPITGRSRPRRPWPSTTWPGSRSPFPVTTTTTCGG